MTSSSNGIRVKANLVKDMIVDVREMVECHGQHLANLGRQCLNQVIPHFRVDRSEHSIFAEVREGKSFTHSVVLTWEDDTYRSDPLVDMTCSCPTSRNYDLCRHTWAVGTAILLQLIDPNSPLVRELKKNDPDAWKQMLNPLDQFLSQTTISSTTGTGAAENEPEEIRRLIYRLDQPHREIEVSVCEQVILKNGGWSKGRKMTWERFSHEPQFTLAPVDQQVLRLVKVPLNNGYGFNFHRWAPPNIWDLLPILKDHPHVVHESDPETPLEIIQAEMELVLKEEGSDHLAIIPSLNGHSLLTQSSPLSDGSDGAVVFDHFRGIIAPSWLNHKLYYWEGSPAAVRLIENLCQRRPIVPRSGLPELLNRLTQLEQSFKVIYPKEIAGRTDPGDSRVHVRLISRAADGGLAVELWTRPVPGGAYFEPGEGAGEIASFDPQSRQRKTVKRNLEAERAEAQQCQQALQLDRYYSHRPWRWLLDGGDHALDFLHELDAHKDVTWIVEWTNSAVPRPALVGEITPADLSLVIGKDHDWFGVEGTIDIGGERVPLMTLLDALRKNSKYVQLKGGKWAKIAAEFRDRLAALDDLLHRHQSKFNIDATAAPLLEDLFNEHQINFKAAAEWQAALKRLEFARQHNPVVPIDLKAELRDYQIDGYKWLSRLAAWGVGGCLADDMGLGKTVQTLAVLVERQSVGPTLVVAPVSVGFNWTSESARFAPTLRPHLYRDTERGEFLESVGPGDVVVASYGLLLRDAEYFTKICWGTLVLDEAQFIKNSRTKSAQVVRELNADWRLTLTGTPVENQLGDLWSLFRATSPGLFGSWERFRERFADPIEKQKLAERQQALAQVVRPFILRRTKDEVLKELPSRTEMILTAELSKPERKLYEDARLFALAQISGIDTGKNESRFQVLAMLTRLRQLACHPRLVDEKWKDSSAKLDVLLETVDEIIEGKHRALIFSQFTSHLEIIRKALDAKNISYLYLDGQTPAKQRRERVSAFQEGQGDLFLISLKAGGTGLNLTGADYVIHMDPWWNPAVEDQATDRAHRIGQTKPVMVYRVVAADTIEEKILALHDQKRNLVAGIMEGSDQAGKLSTEELVDLIKSSHTPEMPVKEKETTRTRKSRTQQRAK